MANKKVTCAFHEYDNAVLFCKYHREFLCLICVTEKKHNETDCSLVSMKDIKHNEGQDTLLIECLQKRQLIKQRKKQRVEFCKVYETLSEKLVLMVNKEKKTLMKTIENLAESSEKQAIDEISDRKSNLENESQKLDDMQLRIDDLITQIESQENNEPKNTGNNILEIFKTISEELENKSELRDRWTKPSGILIPLKTIAEIKNSLTLGKIFFESDEAYASIDEDTLTDENESKISENNKQTQTTKEDEIVYKPDSKKEHNDTIDTAATKTVNSKSNETSPTPKEEKRRSKSNWFGFGKKKSKDLPSEKKKPEIETEKL